ncbi:translation initiation factor [candidate division KSB1 bacterium]|nr:translation initiation factor [candidate division KSB1 bacterium]
MSKDTLVYSTDPTKRKCPVCGQYECVCQTIEDRPLSGQTATLVIERKGRKGKTVTIVRGLKVNPFQLATIAKTLKQRIGTGGTAKQGQIEIQGDHREKVAMVLREMGVRIS